MSTTLSAVIKVAEESVGIDGLNPAHTPKDVGFDSLDHIDFIMELEDEFVIDEISEKEANDLYIMTFADIAKVIDEKRGANGQSSSGSSTG